MKRNLETGATFFTLFQRRSFMSYEQSDSQWKTQLKFFAVFALQTLAQGALMALGAHAANKVINRPRTAALPAGESGGNVSQLRKAV
jgi:hypothetical protein